MEEKDKASAQINTMMTQSIEQARGAMENYLQFFQRGISASPWAGTDLSKKLVGYAQQNVATAFGFAQRLAQAKDLPDVVQIQTEFFQTQLKSLTEQAKDLGETATGAFKAPSSRSS